MHDEVLDVPAVAEGRLVLADLEGGVAQGGALELCRPGASRQCGSTLGWDRDEQRRGTLRDGFAVLGVAIRREPWIFTLSTLGSVLFGALTVADAWVLGWSTDHVVLPAFETATSAPVAC